MSLESGGYRESDAKENLKEPGKPKTPEELSILFGTSSVIEGIKKGYSRSKEKELEIKKNIPAEYHNGLADISKGVELGYYERVKEANDTEKFLELQYTEIFQQCFLGKCPTIETVKRGYADLQNGPDFNLNNLRNSELGLETPLLDPLDIILLLASFGEILGKLGLKLLSKGCSLLLKNGKIFIKTIAGDEVELVGKGARKIFEKYKDKLQSLGDIFEPATTNGIPIPKTPKLEFKPGNIARAEIVGDAIEKGMEAELFNIISNRMIFRNSAGEFISAKEFALRFEELGKVLKPEHLVTQEARFEYLKMLKRMEEYIEGVGKSLGPDKTHFTIHYHKVLKVIYEMEKKYLDNNLKLSAFAKRAITDMEKIFNSIIN